MTGIVPQAVRWREEEAQRYFDEWGGVFTATSLAFEMQDRQRVILENQLLPLIPFAAEVPFEVWIMPKRHQADFGQISNEENQICPSPS